MINVDAVKKRDTFKGKLGVGGVGAAGGVWMG